MVKVMVRDGGIWCVCVWLAFVLMPVITVMVMRISYYSNYSIGIQAAYSYRYTASGTWPMNSYLCVDSGATSDVISQPQLDPDYNVPSKTRWLAIAAA